VQSQQEIDQQVSGKSAQQDAMTFLADDSGAKELNSFSTSLDTEANQLVTQIAVQIGQNISDDLVATYNAALGKANDLQDLVIATASLLETIQGTCELFLLISTYAANRQFERDSSNDDL
jgi:hypothetical protein